MSKIMELVFATNNLHKLTEVQNIVPTTIKIVSLKQINCFEDIVETETTLEGNAKLKAVHVKSNYGYSCFADDTGLEVESLDGKPGVYSARYAGEPANAENNIDKLLLALNGKTNRKAQFRTSICLLLEDKEYFFDGICKGEIISERRGTNGFGYDPVFVPEGYTTTFAEMTDKEKNKISHRGLAIQKLTNFLQNYFD